VLERAAILSPDAVLRIPALPIGTAAPPPAPSARLASVVRQHIEAALRACQGRIYGPDGAAARLGIPPSTLQSKLKRLRIGRGSAGNRRRRRRSGAPRGN